MRKAAQKAFTMIELLVVIAVIGVMATAVLSAINPLEQINKGMDTSLRSDAEQLLSAVDRYYSSLSYFPWQANANDNTNLNLSWQNVITANTTYNMVGNLESTQEIKHGFGLRLIDTNRKPLSAVYNSTADSPSMYACFSPASNSFLTEAENRCKGTPQTDGTPFGDNGSNDNVACGGIVGIATTCKANKTCLVCLP